MRKKVLIEAGVVWNSIWSHSHETAKALSKKYDVYYLEPVRTKAKHSHLFERTKYSVPEHITLIQHKKVFDDLNFSYLTYSESDNLRIIKKIKPDFLLTYQCFLGTRAFLYARKIRAKIFYMFIDDYAALSATLLVKTYITLMEPYMMRKSDGVICTAKILADRAKKYNKNVLYLPNGINTAALGIAPVEAKNKRTIVGFVGTLGNWVDTSWFVTIAKKYPRVDVHVIGGGEGISILEKAKQEQNLKNLKLLGVLPHPVAMKEVEKFDISLVPFKVNKITHAVSPIKLFEYWSMGKPVVCARTMETEQFDGRVVFANDKTIAKNIKPLITSRQKRVLYGKKGHEIAHNFDWQSLGEKLEKFVTGAK